MDAIQIENVSKVYRIGEVETHALNGVSLTMAEGEFTALVGPSGSGKTTLLQLIGCLDKPDQGAVKIKGKDVTRLNANQRADLRREEIGFIFQFFALVPVLNAYENVELPLLLSNVKAQERRRARDGVAEGGRVVRSRQASPRSDERRRAAARRDCARPRAATLDGAGRRADGQPRY